jgi:hypothetical protein
MVHDLADRLERGATSREQCLDTTCPAAKSTGVYYEKRFLTRRENVADGLARRVMVAVRQLGYVDWHCEGDKVGWKGK